VMIANRFRSGTISFRNSIRLGSMSKPNQVNSRDVAPDPVRVGLIANLVQPEGQHFRPRVTNDYDEIFARLAAEHFDAAYILEGPLSSQPQSKDLAHRGTSTAQACDAHRVRRGLFLASACDCAYNSADTIGAPGEAPGLYAETES
jgi:hypothetical protein